MRAAASGFCGSICGVRVEWRGREKLPPGAYLVACKHQSVWETFALFALLPDPAYVLKHELMWIPLFGWLAAKAGMIPVNRGAHATALARMTAAARKEIARSRQIAIFPEGTRRPPDAKPRYLPGIAFLYAETNLPCIPIALNSGLFWPRHTLRRPPGTVLVEVLDPIPAGLDGENSCHGCRAYWRRRPRAWSRREGDQWPTADCWPLSLSAMRCRSVSR